MTSRNILGWFLVSGLLLGVGFIVPWLWWCSLCGLGLQFWLIRKQSYPASLFGSVLAWFIKYLFALSYFWYTLPLDWLPLDVTSMAPALVFGYWTTAALVLALGVVVLPGLYVITKKYLSEKNALVITAVVGVPVAEVLGSVLFSLFSVGSGSTINAAFSFGYVGYLLASHHILAHIALFGGVYLLTVVSALLGVLGILWVQTRSGKVSAIAALIFLGLTSSVMVPTAYSNVPTTVAVIELKTPKGIATEASLRRQATMVAEAVEASVQQSPDYILLPEGAAYFLQYADPTLAMRWFSFQHASSGVRIIDSGRVGTATKGVLEGGVYDARSNTWHSAHKQYLVPQGEYMPYVHSALLRTLGFGATVEQVASVINYVPGPQKSQQAFPVEYPRLLFCFESIVPTGVRSVLSGDTVPFVAHPVSHAWFNAPDSLWHQLTLALRVQAIWNQVPIVTAGNHAPSYAVGLRGEIITPTWQAEGEGWRVGVVRIQATQ